MKRFSHQSFPIALLFIFCTIVGYLLITHTVRRAGDTDTLGYIYAGEQLALGEGLTYRDQNNVRVAPHFSLNAFRIVRDSSSDLKYLGFPPGLPVILASANVLTGRQGAAYFVAPLFAVLGLIATYALALALSKKTWVGLFAVVLLVSTPNFWRYGTETWSEIPSLSILTSGLALYWYSRRQGKYRALVGALAGVLLGYSVWIRYTNVMVLAGVGLFELWTGQANVLRQRWRWSLYAPIIGSLIGILWFNETYYGGLFLTSYSPENGWYVEDAFSLSYAFGEAFAGGYSAIEGARSLWQNFRFWLIFIPLGLWAAQKKPRFFLLLIALPVLFLYSIYAFPAKDINSRFLLITYPAIAILIAHGIVFVSRQWSPVWQVMLAIGISAYLMLPVGGELDKANVRIQVADAEFHQMRAWVNNTEPEAVFISYLFNDRLFSYGERSVFNYRHMLPYSSAENKYRYDQFQPCFVEAIDTMLAQNIPVYYVEDQNPSLYKSYLVLQENYVLEQKQENPNIVKVISETAERNPLPPCIAATIN